MTDLRKPRSVSMNDAEHCKFKLLGGSAWLRSCIEADWLTKQQVEGIERRNKKVRAALDKPPPAAHIPKVEIRIKPEGVAWACCLHMSDKLLSSVIRIWARAGPKAGVEFLDATGTPHLLPTATAVQIARNEQSKRELRRELEAHIEAAQKRAINRRRTK